MYTHTIQHCFPQENLTPFPIPTQNRPIIATNEQPNKRNYIFGLRYRSDSAEAKSKQKSSRFSTKIKAILKSPTAPRSAKPVRIGSASGKKVTWNVDEEQVQPGESHNTGADAWPSADSEEDQQVNACPMDHGSSYVMTPDIMSDDENLTPSHIHHRREDEIYDQIIPIHTRSINPLRAGYTPLKVSHKRSSSLPAEDGLHCRSDQTNHKRFASCDDGDSTDNTYQHLEAELYKQANVDWTKNRVKSNESKTPRADKQFFASWSDKNSDQSILEELSQFLDNEPPVANKKLAFPACDDQLSIIESEVSSVHTFFENDDRFEEIESHSFLYPQDKISFQQSQLHDEYYNPNTTPTRMMLPPIHPQPSRKSKESYIILPMQSYEISTVCEVTFSSELTLLPSNSQTEITFETNGQQQQPISRKVSPIICEISDSQYPPYYINSSSSMPHLHYITKSNPRMSYKQIYPRGKNTLPRTKRQYNSPYQHMIPEDPSWEEPKRLVNTPSSVSNSHLSCDKSTGQFISPNLRRTPFRRGELSGNDLTMRPSISFSHLYTNNPHPHPRSVGSLKGSVSDTCVRDEHTQSSSYMCYTTQDASPAYIPQETQSPYMNIDMFLPMDSQGTDYSELEGNEQSNIVYKQPPRYFTPHPLGTCLECSEYIYPSACQPIRIRNQLIHPDCFKCNDCYSLLHVLSYHVVDGKFYCPRDFRRHVTCHLCKQPIASYRGRESPVNIYNKFFHPNCYRCTSCSIQNHKLSFDGRWLLCLACAHARRQQILKPVTQKRPDPRKTFITLL